MSNIHVIDSDTEHTIYFGDENKELLRIASMVDGTVVVTISGSLHDAAKLFWDVVRNTAPPDHNIIVTE